MTRLGTSASAFAVVVLSVATPTVARAELVTFATGRTMSVAGHSPEGDGTLVFALRGGGEMVVDASQVAAIEPDEVPYGDPTPALEQMAEVAPVPGPRVEPAFDSMITLVAREKGVDATLVRAVIQVESDYQPRARSPKGAVGLMQLLPATARRYGVRNLYDPLSNIRAGVSHLRWLLDRFPLGLALAAYNAGEGAVERFAGVPPYRETVDYVARIRALIGR